MKPISRQKTGTSHWTGGFWSERWNTCRDNMIPRMWDVLKDEKVSHSWQNFLIAAGLAEGEHSGPPFHDGDFYKWLEGASRIYGPSDNAEWQTLLDSIIRVIGKVQREDGYIFTYDAIQKRNRGRSEALQNDLNFEVYNMGHLMSAGCVHFKTTGKKNLLDLAEKSASYLINQFSTLDSARTVICPSHYMGLAELYRTTGRSEYLDLMEKLILLRDNVPEGTDDNQDRVPLKQHREIVGHAVRANYLYAGLTDLFSERGDDDYRRVLESVWKDLYTKKIYLTGGCGALYDGVSPYGCDDYNYIQRTHQSYGRAYELPNTAGYNETCASIGSYLWNYRMAQTLGDGKYDDAMERALYNSILSGMNLEGDRYFYTNALRSLENLPYTLKWSRHRESYIESFCCPPNVVRTIAETPDKICIEKDGGPAILLYGDSLIEYSLSDTARVKMKIDTAYPFDGDIEILIQSCSATTSFPLSLRIPEWTDSFTAWVKGDEITDSLKPKQGFLKISRRWQEGDTVRLSLPMQVKLIESHPMAEESRNHLALMRGPLVYCLESADLPKGCSISSVYIEEGSRFTAEKKTIGTSEMTVLRGDLWQTADENWSDDALYRVHRKEKTEKFQATLIPYFAWDNRERGEMTVWIPRLPGQ